MSNLKPAPLALSPHLAAKLVGSQPAFGKGIARLPITGSLVDQVDAAPDDIDEIGGGLDF